MGRPAKLVQRQQLELWLLYLASLAGVLLLFALVLRGVFQQSQLATIRAALTVVSEDLASLPLPEPGSERDLQESRKDFATAHQQVEWFVKGVAVPVARLGEVRTIGPLPALAPGKRLLWQHGPDWIALVRPVDSAMVEGHAPGTVWLRVSEGLENTEAQLTQLDLALAASVGAAMLLSLLMARLLTQRAVQPLQRSLSRLRQFSLDASHELRGPLAALGANVEMALLESDPGLTPQRRRFEAIGLATAQMEQMVDDLLLLARQDEQRIEHAEPVDLSALMELQLDLIRDGLALRQQRLSIELECELIVLGQPILLQRLFRNLLDNAQRYTPDQGLVSVTAQRRGGLITVAVEDSGVGLTADQLPRVFDRFWRASPDRGVGGTGLGLAIASRICLAHGGSIRVTSQLGEGSCFLVDLPAYQAI
ncbi:MAG: sensor histidine kinase [Synechococcaceae bacterium WB4_2_0811]|nr:sensor histidine kinase [Synechococcaceae bacterium WB4_2_0811]